MRDWEHEIDHHQVSNWVEKHRLGVEAGLGPKKKPGNPLSRFEHRKELSYEGQLLYKIELHKRKLLKKGRR